MARVQLPEIDEVGRSLDMSAAEIIRARRTCTVPHQLSRSLELPSVIHVPSRVAVPRRYEETRPVQIQNLTHQHIMDIGHFINQQAEDVFEKEKTIAVERAIADAWEQAESSKATAVKEAVETVHEKHERIMRKQARQYEKAIKEEAIKVETVMQNKMREALEEERCVAEKLLKQAIEKVKEEWEIKLHKAVATARQEEQEYAAKEELKLKQEFQKTITDINTQWKRDKESAMTQLNGIKETQRKQEIQAVKEAAESIRRAQLNELQAQHENSLIEAKAALDKETQKIEERNSVIEILQRKRELLYDELVKVHADYQDFINKHPLFDAGQTDYLLNNFKNDSRIENPYCDSTANKYSNTRTAPQKL